MANDKYYGFKPKSGKSVEEIAKFEQFNPYEFRKGMDYELTELGCSRLKESTPEEREKATEKVFKNLESHPAYYSGLIQFETGMNQAGQIDGKNFKTWLNDHFDINKMQPAIDEKFKKIKTPNFKDDKMKELKESIQREVNKVLKEQSAKQAAMADMEDAGEKEGGKKGKGKAKKDKPIRKDRFDREEEAIKDILFRVDAKGKKPKEEGDYTKEEPAPGSMLAIKDEMLDKYKELKAKEEDPKKTLEEYNKLLIEKNEEYKESIEKFVEEFEGNGVSMDIFGEKLSDTIKNLQQRLKDGLNKARAGVEEEARGMRRQVAETQMTREEALKLLDIIKENGVSLREGTDMIRPYYEIAKAAYLEGVANALHL